MGDHNKRRSDDGWQMTCNKCTFCPLIAAPPSILNPLSKLLVATLHVSVATFVAEFLVSNTVTVSRSISQFYFSIYIRAT